MNVPVDTNVMSELKRGRNAAPRVKAWFAALLPENVFTSVIVLGEIRRGIELVARRDQPQAEALEQWYASVRERLGNRILVIDEPVMAIAATALAHGLIVATRNTEDYRRAGARVINPWEDRP